LRNIVHQRREAAESVQPQENNLGESALRLEEKEKGQQRMIECQDEPKK
jgi:hypothetical protein